jgi:hypothetical protein
MLPMLKCEGCGQDTDQRFWRDTDPKPLKRCMRCDMRFNPHKEKTPIWDGTMLIPLLLLIGLGLLK